MKRMKKLASLLLAVVMVMAMGMTAMASGTLNTTMHSLKITADTNRHTYEAYQIFKGEYLNGKLAKIEWGDGINGEALLAALQATDDEALKGKFSECTTAADVAKALEGVEGNSAAAKAFANEAGKHLGSYTSVSGGAVEKTESEKPVYEYTISNLPDGYYLVKDEDNSLANEHDAYTDFILEVIGDVTAKAKAEFPSVDKSITGDVDKDGKVVTHDPTDAEGRSIGDIVEFTLTSRIPSLAVDYDYYYFILTDTLSKGLTYQAGKLVVKIGDVEAREGEDYILTVGEYDPENGTKITISLKNATTNAGKNVVVTYQAQINKDAIVGVEGNPNTVGLQFSNNPNEDYKKRPDENEDGIPDDLEDKPLGKTPEKTVYVFTTEIGIEKVDENGEPLTGAGFTITGDSVNMVVELVDEFTPDASGEYYKLKDNTYTKVAPTTEDKMVLKTDEKPKSGYVKTSDTTRSGYIEVGGFGYAPATSSELSSGTEIYTYFHANTDKYDSTTQKYKRESKAVLVTSEGSMGVAGMVDADGKLFFTGLGAGNYTIEETTVPTGYNKAPNVSFTITWQWNGSTDASHCKWDVQESEMKDKVSYDELTGKFTIQIENLLGSLLPETGGIGTTIFYTAGAILVLGAIVLLVVKKRMSKEM